MAGHLRRAHMRWGSEALHPLRGRCTWCQDSLTPLHGGCSCCCERCSRLSSSIRSRKETKGAVRRPGRRCAGCDPPTPNPIPPLYYHISHILMAQFQYRFHGINIHVRLIPHLQISRSLTRSSFRSFNVPFNLLVSHPTAASNEGLWKQTLNGTPRGGESSQDLC